MILFFTSPIGLGHASRDAAVAAHLEDVVFVTGGPAADLLANQGHNVQNVYSPPPFQVAGGHLRRKTIWLARYYMYYRRCKSIATRMLENYHPDIIVSDEDFAALAAGHRGIPRVAITDITQSRFLDGLGGMVERRMNGAMQDMLDSCDAVIMPLTGREAAMQDMANLHMVGPIVRPILENRDHLRQKFGMRKKTILVTVGGTDAGGFLLDMMREVAKTLEGIDVVFVPGPALGDDLVHDLHQMVMAADVVVSLAGRSTMDEAAAYGTPGIFIPIAGHFEQEDNAARLGHTHQDMNRLHHIIWQKLQERRHPVPTEGAMRAAHIIKSLN